MGLTNVKQLATSVLKTDIRSTDTVITSDYIQQQQNQRNKTSLVMMAESLHASMTKLIYLTNRQLHIMFFTTQSYLVSNVELLKTSKQSYATALLRITERRTTALKSCIHQCGIHGT